MPTVPGGRHSTQGLANPRPTIDNYRVMKTKLKSLTPEFLKNQRGLTLVEIIVVLVILAVLMSWLGGKLFSMGASAKADLTRLKMNGLKQNVYLYQMRNNSLPSDLKATGASENETDDAWGNAIQFRTADGGRGYELKSQGGDGKDGGSGSDEDITLKGP